MAFDSESGRLTGPGSIGYGRAALPDAPEEPVFDVWKVVILAIIFLVLSVLNAIFAGVSTDVDWTVDTVHGPIPLPVDGLCFALCTGFFGLAVVCFLTWRVMRSPMGVDKPNGHKMYEIWSCIHNGAKAFLIQEYKVLGPIIGVLAILLVFADLTDGGWKTSLCMIIGAFLSALCGWIGMAVATQANVRTANKAREGLPQALRLAFDAGGVMGLVVVCAGLIGLALAILIFRDTKNVSGFGFGASLVALFARVGGGIFTKAADVGADLVGKVEEDIPEDDPRNPAVVADNVGDNVGDVAGMGADLFESYTESIIAAIVLAVELKNRDMAKNCFVAPLFLSGAGLLCSIVGTFCVQTKETGGGKSLMNVLLGAIRKGIFIAAVLNVICGCLILHFLDLGWETMLPFILGLLSGVLIGLSTEYYTSFEYVPTKGIATASLTGAAPVIIEGLYVGMVSTVFPVTVVFCAIVPSVLLGNWKLEDGGGEYCVAIAAIGMLSTLGITLATDAYGPVADNAGGIAEMAGLEEIVRHRTDALDALGNTTAATGKGFCIGSAVLTALPLLSAFAISTNLQLDKLALRDVYVLCGVLFGGMLPYLFAALAMKAVGNSAQEIIQEVRRQFREIPGLREGTAKADTDACVRIATASGIRYMIAPGLLAVLTPVFIGIIFGPRMLVGLLAGGIVSAFMLAMMMANAGGAWDNAKKYVEGQNLYDERREKQGKGSTAHKGTVVGDTVGDPFKDTAGPALNILIKLMSITALVMAPLLKKIDWWMHTL